MTVLVIGAGVIGAAVADELARRGVRVTVLEMRSPGRGASQASAGLLAPYNEAHGHSALLDLCTKSLDLYDAFVDRVRESAGLSIAYGREGTLEVAPTEADAGRLQELHAWLVGRQVRADWLDTGAVCDLEPSVAPGVLAGLLIRDQGFVGVSALVHALVQSARLHGAEFASPVEAVRVEPTGRAIEVTSDTGRFTADAVVVAAGTWSGRVRIAGEPPVPVRPIRGQMVQITWSGPAFPSRPIWGSRVYTVPWQPDTLLVGATVEDVGFDERSTVSGVRELLEGVEQMLPAARQGAVAEVRVGLRPATSDGLPIIGPLASEPRIHLATGHYRNGVLLAPLTAALTADRITGVRP